MMLTLRDVQGLREAVVRGRHAIFEHGRDTGRVSLDRRTALALLDAYLDLDEIHRLSDRHRGPEFRALERENQSKPSEV